MYLIQFSISKRFLLMRVMMRHPVAGHWPLKPFGIAAKYACALSSTGTRSWTRCYFERRTRIHMHFSAALSDCSGISGIKEDENLDCWGIPSLQTAKLQSSSSASSDRAARFSTKLNTPFLFCSRATQKVSLPQLERIHHSHLHCKELNRMWS